ncbi:MAG: type II secretion system protein GspJ [Pseudomonadota bacterium]
MITTSDRNGGFTLVETLVALAVFAVVAGGATLIFGQSVAASRQVEAASIELQALQRTRAALRADLARMTARRTRDERGTPRPPVMVQPGAGGDDGRLLLGFVRTGPDRSDREGRPSISYVEWRQTEDGLTRASAPFADGAPVGAPALLLPGASAAEIALHIDGQWTTPVLAAAETTGPGAMVAGPAAVRLSLTLPGYGRLEQAFLTGLPQ